MGVGNVIYDEYYVLLQVLIQYEINCMILKFIMIQVPIISFKSFVNNNETKFTENVLLE